MIILATTISNGQSSTVFHSSFEQIAFSSEDPLQILLASDPEVNVDKYNLYQEDITQIVDKLKAKQSKWSDSKLLEKIFYYVHNKKLDWYENYITLADLMENGTYDCLTGTAFYALILDELEIPYTIYEFDFHVFLVAKLPSDSALFESTDPLYGFVTDPDEIEEHINYYLTGDANTTGRQIVIGSRATSSQKSTVNERISLKELVGLQYYNLAVNAFNNREIAVSRDFIEKAYQLYPSQRISDTRDFFLSSRRIVSLY